MAYSVTRSPTAADGGTGGLAGQMWNSPTSIFISDNSHASHGGYYQGGNNSKPLKATGFGFNIPIGALILGIEVNVEKRASDNNYAEYSTDSYIYLVKNGVQGGTNKAVYTKWPTSDIVVTYGGPVDGWGQVWTSEDINNANFGVSFSAMTCSDTLVRYSYVDYMSVTVHYDLVLPDPPSGLTRTNYDAADAAVFSWTFSDPNTGDTQSAYQMQIIDVSDNSVDYDSGKVTGNASSITLPAGTLTNNKQYQWKVRVWDQSDYVGYYSALASFYTSAKPVCSITSPSADGAILAVAAISVTWSYTDAEGEAQSAYRSSLYHSSGLLLQDSTKLAGANTSFVFTSVSLENDESYYINVTLYDNRDVASLLRTRTFVTSFTGPQQPIVLFTEDDARGSITLSILNPSPQGGDPVFSHNEVFRKKPTESTYTRIVTGLPWNAVFTDYTPQSSTTYSYFVRSTAITTGYRNSTITEHSIQLRNAQLSLMSDNSYVDIIYNLERSMDYDFGSGMSFFAGRATAVAEFSENTELGLQLAFTIKSEYLLSLITIVSAKGIILFRDPHGKREFMMAGRIKIKDIHRGRYYDITLPLERTSYTEAVT